MSIANDKSIAVKKFMERQLHLYRNYAPKLSLIAFTLAYTGYVFYGLCQTPIAQLQIIRLLMDALLFSSGFSIIGYVFGKFISEELQDQEIRKLVQERNKRKESFDGQLLERKRRIAEIDGP